MKLGRIRSFPIPARVKCTQISSRKRYGTATGLKGMNCMHDFYLFWEGASVISDDLEEPAPVNINGKEYTYYQVSQQRRKMERDIRATKREIEV